MNLQKLLSVLAKQEQNISELFQIGLDKKTVLVENNYDKLNEIVSLEEQKLLSIQLTEENRLRLMRDLFSEFKIDNTRYKLGILVENLKGKIDNKILSDISFYENRITKLINDVTTVNSLNMMLIQQSRSLIHETIQAVINTNNRSILDRKG
ncbi:MAG: flagellar protein FlgN [Melioribacteraceae bacterium]|nr:flagellar protein FlgN [Melioribacteraceae bacterium]